MVKAPKHRRIKRATVLIKRTRCIRNTKNKSYSPLYQKLKVNNHSLARALSQEKQESQLLFSRNVELLSEVQDLIHACNNRDLVITNVLKNAKDMMQMLVTMSGFLSNTISSCQEFVSNQRNVHRTSSGSTGRRESIRRLSTKSPARGVVKPMVSGHTITKPTINLSRVNMQRLQSVNLSIIEEGPQTPERNLERSVENRHSRSIPERLPVTSLRNEDDEDRVIINRRTNRFSGGRLSSGRYSKRNSGRLSGTGVAGRLSKRSSEYLELLKSPRVTLQDVSRYLTNNQSVNIRMLQTTSVSQLNNTESVNDSQNLEEQSSPEDSNHTNVNLESRDSCESSESEQDSSSTLTVQKSSVTLVSKRNSHKKYKTQAPIIDSHYIDPLEGSSWMHNSSVSITDEQNLNNGVLESGGTLTEEENEHLNSPVSSYTNERRRISNYFRMPELPKVLSKSNVSRISFKNNYQNASENNHMDISNGFLDNDEEDDHRVNLRYITKRRGILSKMPSVHSLASNTNADDADEDDDDEDETLMLNMRRQLNQSSSQQSDQPERLQFDVNELLQLTPLKPLLNRNDRINNGLAQVDVEPEPTTTMQITQRFQKPIENLDTFSRMSNIKMHQSVHPELPNVATVKSQELEINAQNRQINDLTTARMSSKIELPRLTDILNSSEDNQRIIIHPETYNRQKRKKTVLKSVTTSDVLNNEDESPIQKKKPKGRKKKSKDKDPSSAKVVLQKLNDIHQASSLIDATRSDKKNSDESVSSTRSSTLSRVDHSSDSESSTVSANCKQIMMRPRRQKAPKNLQEPNAKIKLRR